MLASDMNINNTTLVLVLFFYIWSRE